jgi:hypothetical protein
VTDWGRVYGTATCGLCRALLPKGAPVLRITIGRVVKLRGECCAGSAPPDLPIAIAERAPIDMGRLQRLGAMLPLEWKRPDFKSRAAAEREPGEEG